MRAGRGRKMGAERGATWLSLTRQRGRTSGGNGRQCWIRRWPTPFRPVIRHPVIPILILRIWRKRRNRARLELRCRPAGAKIWLRLYRRFTPWATFLRRCAADFGLQRVGSDNDRHGRTTSALAVSYDLCEWSRESVKEGRGGWGRDGRRAAASGRTYLHRRLPSARPATYREGRWPGRSSGSG